MRRIVNALLLVVACTACSSTAPAVELPGTYALVSINGQPLPYTSETSTTKSAEMTILSDGTYSEKIGFRRPAGFEPPEGEAIVTGVWSAEGGRYTYTFLATSLNSPLPGNGILTGRKLTIRYPGDTLVWQR